MRCYACRASVIGGDRTLRHNAIGDAFFADTQKARLRPEREKQGLLPPRPDDEVVRGEDLRGGRWPADVWIPSYSDGLSGAVDFAVTWGLRSDIISSSVHEPSAVFGRYETFKKQFLNKMSSVASNKLKSSLSFWRHMAEVSDL